MSETFPVYIQHAGKRTAIGIATKAADGFDLTIGDISISNQPVAAPKPVTGPLPELFPNYGKSKGAPIYGASMQDLEYYANGARRSLADPGKARWHDKERALLAAIEGEIARQAGADPRTGEIPPPADDDLIPF